jgi:hypothetical protein
VIIVQKSDFVGFQSVARSTANDAILQACIDRNEKNYIYQILGVTLGDLFIASLVNGVPVGARYLAIFNEINILDNYTLHQSKGLKDILVSMIMWNYLTENAATDSQSGVMAMQSESANTSGFENVNRFAEKRWNDALENIDTITWYVYISQTATYPEYTPLPPIRPKYSAIL